MRSKFKSGYYTVEVKVVNKDSRQDYREFTASAYADSQKKLECFRAGMIAGIIAVLGTDWEWKRIRWKVQE